MELSIQKYLSITFLDDEVVIFRNIISKLLTESKRSGYKHHFHKDECELIKNINEYIEGYEKNNPNSTTTKQEIL